MAIKLSKKEYDDIVKKVGPEKMKKIESASRNGDIADGSPPKAVITVHSDNIIGAEFLEQSRKEGIPVTDISMSVWERCNIGKNIVADEKNIALVEDNKKQIIGLHSSIQGHLRTSLDKATQAGKLLMQQKELIRHGGFGHWILANMPFKVRTAQNYMKLYHYCHLLSEKKINSITDAYAVINGEPVFDEVIDIDDGINTTNKLVVAKSTVSNDLDLPMLPPKKAAGLMAKMVVDQKLIQQIKNGESIFAGQKSKYVKIVVPIPSEKYQNPQLIGEFTCAAASLLKAGGKLIYHKM